MSKQSLIIVESPSKARTIERYLGKEYRVLACNGHIKDLPKSDLGIDIENNFATKYVLLPEKYKVIKKIKEIARHAPQILIATDPDREGEAIAWHLVTELDGKSSKIKRVLFNEITSSGIQAGIQNMRNVDMQLVDAQKARRVIDRIVGFKVSEFLWRVLFNGLSAGRVQSVALRLVCERHQEIIDFKPVEYWTLGVQLKSQKGEIFIAQLHQIKNQKPEIPNEAEADRIIRFLEDKEFMVSSIRKRLVKKKPYAPFITSTLQQEAANRLGFSPANTMRIAQKLYEGIDIGDGAPTGLITYMRTDSTRISNEAIGSVRKLISHQYGNEYLPKKAIIYASKKKLVQDAHEAIRPSKPDLTPQGLKDNLGKDEFKLYELIWQRFVASQMTPTVLNQTTIDILAGDDHVFRTNGSVVKFDGFRKVYPMARKSEDQDTPKYLAEGEIVERLEFKPEQHFTKPLPYFTESSLIKELDSRGIGRPSTFAEIIFRLKKREYVTKEKGKLIPTEIGMTVNKVLTNNLPDIFDFQFTARMEEELDNIETGKLKYLDVVNDFYKPFHISINKARDRRSEIKSALVETTSEVCEKCGSKMVIKWNSRGEKFLACSGFPKCRNAKSLLGEESQPEKLGIPCPECGGDQIVKKGRYGRYAGCSNYPECKFTSSISTGVLCPEIGCTGEIVERTSRKGKRFYSCNRYPDCKHVSWNKPILYHCSECNNTYVEERFSKNRGKYYACPNCKQTYQSLEEKVKTVD